MDVGSSLRINDAPSPIVPIIVKNESTSQVKISPNIEIINMSTVNAIATLQLKEQYASTIGKPFVGWNSDSIAGTIVHHHGQEHLYQANVTGPVPGIVVNGNVNAANPQASNGSLGTNVNTHA
ncbi:MAG: hypothetical protein PXZ07_08265 [Candidatus Eremiobacteraeota bacterium]|uniref:Uncharacterized protein n=1 Tax=mine drainage metagenome TaxID=410659 RepID=E6PCW2_9ZZZZ|nr:hypothetical protein [Candidatus Eremiobacteraeota bacterium]NNM99279.1 hypothetical protein [Candidatus Eremiobacteraeota bacterium]